METYTNEQAQETIAQIKSNKPVTKEALMKVTVYILATKYVKYKPSMPCLADGVYKKLVKSEFADCDKAKELLIRLIKRKDWKSLYIVVQWGTFPESAPFHNQP